MRADPAILRAAVPADVQVLRDLKSGGQGSVFHARMGGVEVALKVFKPDAHPERLTRELRTLSEIDCPNLVRVLRYETAMVGTDAYAVVAYEFHPGGDLTVHLQSNSPPLDERELASIGAQVGHALDVLWQRRIVHRDVKPENIVRAADGRAVLVDIGVARHLDEKTLTIAGGICGTLGYMSPEQALGRKQLTAQSDSFGLGLTLYILASRQHPWGGRQEEILRRNATSLASLRPDLSKEMISLIDSMLARPAHLRPVGLASRFSALGGGR